MARGELLRVRHGIYAPRALWQELPPWDRYLARVHAVSLMHPEVVFSHESAAALTGGPVFGDPIIVHVMVDSSSASRLVAGVRTHRTTEDRGVVELGGIAITSWAETAVDIARSRHPAVALAVADAALRADPSLMVDSLTVLNESRSSSRGRNIARWSLSRANALAETALESISSAVIEWLGFPGPDLQVTFDTGNGQSDRSDFVWTDHRLAGEADGDLKYDGRFGDPRGVLRRQAERDHRLRGHVRNIAHWGWSEATSIAPLRSILHAAGVPTVCPENPAALFSLKRSVSSRAPHRTAAET